MDELIAQHKAIKQRFERLGRMAGAFDAAGQYEAALAAYEAADRAFYEACEVLLRMPGVRQ